MVTEKTTFTCPGCSIDHEPTPATFSYVSPLVNRVLCDLMVECSKCEKIRLEDVERDCKQHHSRDTEITLEDVIQQPLESEPTRLEKQAAVNLVSRMLHQTDTDSISLPRRGNPLHLIKVTSPTVPSGESSSYTKRRRSKTMSEIRKHISLGDMESQMADEVKRLPNEEREQLMKDADFSITIPPEAGLAMKADLCLPWRKLRLLRRWMKSWGANMASEEKQRVLMKQQLSQLEVRAESVPFSFNLKQGGQELRPAPLAFVDDLKVMVFHLLDEKQRLEQLTWHDGLILCNEIWIKIGGDKAGSCFKASLQLVNVSKPNSVRNSCVFSVFEALDSSSNLHIALDRYHDQIAELQEANWKGYTMRFFMSGDYEFLCHMYGLSGASGRHSCLWCSISSEQMKIPRNKRHVTPRSLDTLTKNHKEFLGSGGDLRKAKQHQNVIGPMFFNIPLLQVCPPGLHITLGIFQRLFTLLESECHQLDMEATLLGNPTATSSSSSSSFDDYHQAKSKLMSLEEEETRVTAEKHQAEQVLVLLLLTVPNCQQNPQVEGVSQLINTNAKQISEIQTLVDQQKRIMGKGFHKEDGIFVKALDEALSSFNVERQAYHGGSFIGNHIHRTLKPTNTATLCQSPVQVATQYSPQLLSRAEEVSQRFLKAFSLFYNCHKLYDSTSKLSDIEITSLGLYIDEFVAYYRDTFPNSTFFPKLHMLEDHVLPWIKQWKVGSGLMGEQGAESLHAKFNTTEKAYNNMRDRVQRLKVVLQAHHLQSLPENQALEPPLLKRKKGEKHAPPQQ